MQAEKFEHWAVGLPHLLLKSIWRLHWALKKIPKFNCSRCATERRAPWPHVYAYVRLAENYLSDVKSKYTAQELTCFLNSELLKLAPTRELNTWPEILLSMNVIVFWLDLIRLQLSMNVCILANFSGISDVLINSEGYLQRFYQFYEVQAQCFKKHW